MPVNDWSFGCSEASVRLSRYHLQDNFVHKSKLVRVEINRSDQEKRCSLSEWMLESEKSGMSHMAR